MDKLAFRPQELPDLLGLSRNTVYTLLRTGKIRAVRVGRRLVVPRSAIEAWLKEAGCDAQR